MEKKNLTAKNRGRKKQEAADESLLEESPPEGERGNTPLASSTPVTSTTKRRGRPARITAKNQNTPEQKSYPKRNRTPVKVDVDIEDENNSLVLDRSQTLSMVSETNENSKEESESNTEQTESVKKVGRKRGRPSQKLQDSVEEIPTPKRRKGTSIESKTMGDSGSGVKDKQVKRGRQKAKKKDKVVEEYLDEDYAEDDQMKTGTQQGNSKTLDTSASKNNRRGSSRRKPSLQPQVKPENSSSEDELTEDSITEGTPSQKTPKKERKPKSTEQDGESDVTCLRCQEKFSNLTTLKYHMMRKHTVLYTADCPEGKDDRTSVRQILKTRNVLNCSKCDKELRSVQYYYKHLEWCGRENENFTCTVCDRVYKKMYEVEHYRNHKLQDRKEKELKERRELQKKEAEEREKEAIKAEVDKKGRRVRKAAKKAVNVLKDISSRGDAFAEGDDDDVADPDLQLDIEEEDDEEDEGEDVDEDASDESDVRISEKANTEINLDSDHSDDSEEESPRKRRTANRGGDVNRDVYVHCLEKNLKRCQLIDSMPNVFPELKPQKSQWKLQDSKEAEEYLPVTQESVRFQSVLPGKTVNQPVQKLRRFQSECINGTHNYFAGGPVWGLAWCPMPHNVIRDQFLAISCHRQMDEKHETKAIHSGNGSIQLWNVGKLNSISPEASMKSSVPFLEFCLSHCYGVIYQLCWCPSNAWENPQTEESSELLPRIGLLAGAFSDGNVHIFSWELFMLAMWPMGLLVYTHLISLSLPHPESLNLEKQTSVPPRSFKPNPVVTLAPCSTSRQDKKFPCLCVDWQPKSCQFIGAGYGDGTIRVWDLKSQSNLLRLATSPTIILLPFHVSAAHSDSVMGLKWSPHVIDKFATSSRDRSFAMWNLKNRHFPMYRSPAQMSLSVYWLPFNFCVLQGMDDCYTNLEAYVRTESYDHLVGDENTTSDPIVSISDCLWGLTCSDYLMVVLTSNNAGIVSGCIMPHLKRKEVKRFHRRPVVVYETAVQEKDFENESDLVQGKKKSKADSTVFTSYESGKDSVYLEYREYDPSKTKRKLPVLSVPADDIRSIPYRAIYRTEICPNFQSCTWVATGGQAGVVRIHSLDPHLLPTTKEDLKKARKTLGLPC